MKNNAKKVIFTMVISVLTLTGCMEPPKSAEASKVVSSNKAVVSKPVQVDRNIKSSKIINVGDDLIFIKTGNADNEKLVFLGFSDSNRVMFSKIRNTFPMVDTYGYRDENTLNIQLTYNLGKGIKPLIFKSYGYTVSVLKFNELENSITVNISK